MTPPTSQTPRRRRLRLAAYLLVAGASVLALWHGRQRLAEPAIDIWLADQAIEGDYSLERLGPDVVEFRNVRLGPADRPDFEASRVRITLGGLPWNPKAKHVELDAPLIRATLDAEGRLGFGVLDPFIPETTDDPLPDIGVQMRDGRFILASPWGDVEARMWGEGRLRNGFAGDARLLPARLSANGCHLRLERGTLHFGTGADHVRLQFDGAAPEAGCDGQGARALVLTLEAQADARMRRWSGKARAGAEAAGQLDMGVEQPAFALSFSGGRDGLSGTWDARAEKARWPAGVAGAMAASGTYEARVEKGLGFSGTIEATGLSVRQGLLPALPASAPPLATAMAGAARRAASAFTVEAPLSGTLGQEGLALHMPRLAAQSRSGAKALFDGGSGLKLASGQLTAAGDISLSGGGFPAVEGRLSEARFATGAPPSDGRVRMQLRMPRWSLGDRQGGADSLAVPAAELAYDAGAISASGRFLYSGGTGHGARVEGLDFTGAVAGRPGEGLAVTSDCALLSVDAVRHPAVTLGPAHITACPDGRFGTGPAGLSGGLAGTLRIQPVRLSGTLRPKGEAFRIDTVAMKLVAGRNGLSLGPVPVRASLGAISARANVSASLPWKPGKSQPEGRFSGLSLSGEALPATVRDAAGKWSAGAGGLSVSGLSATLLDGAAPARINPLLLTGASVAQEGDRLTISGGLAHPRGKAAPLALATLRAVHDLPSGRGSARIDAGQLRFGESLQPYQLSELARGVIENVEGLIAAEAAFAWDETGARGTGSAALSDISFATSAFGPVSGVNGAIRFTDLFDLVSAPGQEMRIASMNPGVLVEDGRIRFSLPGGGRLQVEAAEWPYAGGRLTLDPLLVDPDSAVLAMTLRASGLDAGLFLQGFNLKDINATGTFDGVLPLRFVSGRGSIEGGELSARAPGGLVQYLGNVGADSMGASGKMAFDALRKLRYRSMRLKFDGDLDGELVTEMLIDGRNEAPVHPGGGLQSGATGLPFRFDIRVRAPFRHLLGTAESFHDARAMIRASADNAQELDDEEEGAKAVQPR